MNFESFKKIFDSQEKCINILIENDYIQTTYCSNCNSSKIRKLTGAMKNNYMCKACKKVSNIFKNTVFFNSFVALVEWFYIIYLFINQNAAIPDRIAKETKRSWPTIDKALKKIKKEFKNQKIKEKFNFLLDKNINANINNANDLNNVSDENNVNDVNLLTATESDKNYLYYDLYTRIVYQYALLKHVKDTFATNKKYDFEYDFVDAKMKKGLEDIYYSLDTIVSNIDSFLKNNMSFIDKIEAYYKFKDKEYLKLELFEDFISWSCVEQYITAVYLRGYGEKCFDGSEPKTYDPRNLIFDLESLKNYIDTHEESKKEYSHFQEIINEAKKIIKIK